VIIIFYIPFIWWVSGLIEPWGTKVCYGSIDFVSFIVLVSHQAMYITPIHALAPTDPEYTGPQKHSVIWNVLPMADN